MIYNNILDGVFRSRPSRFVAEVEIASKVEVCHVKNTGRCKEILTPGATVYVSRTANPNRATKYDLIAARKGQQVINIDSQAPNRVFYEYLQKGQYIKDITHIKPEVKHGGSRFDFYVETANRKIFIEVKGVTLERDGVALFPDAPTERGVRHINELAHCIQDGYEAHVVFIIKMKGVTCFRPNDDIHPAFGEALAAAKAAGVKVSAFDCVVTPDSLCVSSPVAVHG